MPSVTEILDTMEYGPAPEQNAHVKDWLTSHGDGFGHFINGAFVASTGKQWIDVTNPADGSLLARVPQGTSKDVDSAVAAARKA